MNRVDPRRADARENVRQILDAARAVFADRGYEVSIEEVARRSGVGMGTIYRHFPSKRALVEEVATGRMNATCEVVREALADEPDAWAAFVRVMHHMAEVRSSQLFPVSRRRTTPSGPELIAARDRLLGELDRLIRRAQSEGALRPDVNVHDLVLMMVSLPPRTPQNGERNTLGTDLTGRHLAVLLDGLRAPGTERLPGAPAERPDVDEFFRTRFGF
ncbi:MULTISPECIES: TetR/AcrR family transcriptional regulator [unclassified Streptomyces]|uniref:TetR/AcrR family transcriptional regulator n=1 Tax=Streptomyces niveiscabiei TaxID=164115 RepID=A0ABW9HSC9_9ACTN|nr:MULTISPECIES: TetR/AcrR family transcriptional regulator [unclassified Streptomyces]QZZ31750.1 TetR/AcrR family transcriptional regulator [Streptomyces sp. ST1015]